MNERNLLGSAREVLETGSRGTPQPQACLGGSQGAARLLKSQAEFNYGSHILAIRVLESLCPSGPSGL